MKSKTKSTLAGYGFLLPLLLGLIIFRYYGFGLNIRNSFFDMGAFGSGEFVGMANFTKLFQDPGFTRSIWNTVKFVVTCVPLVTLFSILSALLLNSKLKSVGVFRTIYFLPAVTLPITVAMVWSWMFNTDYGIINQVLMSLGVTKFSWLGSDAALTVMFTIVIVWSSTAVPTLIILSGLKDISPSYYEAASIDGASGVQTFFRITLPLLTPSIFYVVVTNIISMFQMFNLVYMMVPQTGSVAMNYAQTMVHYYYQNAFVFAGTRGYASAVSVVLMLIILGITMVMFALQKRWVYYDD